MALSIEMDKFAVWNNHVLAASTFMLVATFVIVRDYNVMNAAYKLVR